MKIAIAGSSGFLGSRLRAALDSAGHETLGLVRKVKSPRETRWDPDSGLIDSASLEGIDAAVNLAGENIGERWTAEKKKRIRTSRINSSRLLAETLAKLSKKPSVLLATSAVGIYGDRRDEVLTELTPPGGGFFGELGVEWEAQSKPAEEAGIRVVYMRFGVVLDRTEGVLKKMLPPFRLGIAGPLASGRQYMSWISLEDAVRAVFHVMMDSSISGPVNICSPNPVTNRDFTRALAAVVKRPAFMPVPAFALRILYGEMADEALLSSTRAIPSRLQQSGFQFHHPDIDSALRHAMRD